MNMKFEIRYLKDYKGNYLSSKQSDASVYVLESASAWDAIEAAKEREIMDSEYPFGERAMVTTLK